MDHYGEPWVTFVAGSNLYLNDVFNDEVSLCDTEDLVGCAQLERARDCVNALDGLNPEGIKELVEAVEGIIEWTTLRHNFTMREKVDRLVCALANVRKEGK